jgi:hypothetical protein
MSYNAPRNAGSYRPSIYTSPSSKYQYQPTQGVKDRMAKDANYEADKRRFESLPNINVSRSPQTEGDLRHRDRW